MWAEACDQASSALFFVSVIASSSGRDVGREYTSQLAFEFVDRKHGRLTLQSGADHGETLTLLHRRQMRKGFGQSSREVLWNRLARRNFEHGSVQTETPGRHYVEFFCKPIFADHDNLCMWEDKMHGGDAISSGK